MLSGDGAGAPGGLLDALRGCSRKEGVSTLSPQTDFGSTHKRLILQVLKDVNNLVLRVPVPM